MILAREDTGQSSEPSIYQRFKIWVLVLADRVFGLGPAHGMRWSSLLVKLKPPACTRFSSRSPHYSLLSQRQAYWNDLGSLVKLTSYHMSTCHRAMNRSSSGTVSLTMENHTTESLSVALACMAQSLQACCQSGHPGPIPTGELRRARLEVRTETLTTMGRSLMS